MQVNVTAVWMSHHLIAVTYARTKKNRRGGLQSLILHFVRFREKRAILLPCWVKTPGQVDLLLCFSYGTIGVL